MPASTSLTSRRKIVSVSGHSERGMLSLRDPTISRFVGRAMKRDAAIVHRQLSQGLNSLASITSLAPFVGVLGTLLGIANSFPGIGGQKRNFMAAVFARLSGALVMTAAGLLVALVSLYFYEYLKGRLECFDREMEACSRELMNLLTVRTVAFAPRVSTNLVVPRLTFRNDIGATFEEDQRPWYRSGLTAAGLLAITWCVQFLHCYFTDDTLLIESAMLAESAMLWAALHLVVLFAVSWFIGYPVWVKLLTRRPGGMALLTSCICLGCSVGELFLPVHLW